MNKLIFVALGGGAGAVARYLVGMQTLRAFGSNWPYGTFAVNILGGFLMGALAGYLAHKGGADQERWRLLLGVGVLGGFTTFSAFSLDAMLMLERGDWGLALGYVLASVIGSIAALALGLGMARALA
jgi:CrcB protein